MRPALYRATTDIDIFTRTHTRDTLTYALRCMFRSLPEHVDARPHEHIDSLLSRVEHIVFCVKKYQLLIRMKSGQLIKPQPVDDEVLDSIYAYIADESGKAVFDLEDSKLILALKNVDYLTAIPLKD